ncbi:MAG: winged helix-turn-helix domain-containing protein [Bacteroidota bacterium]
MEIIKLSKHIEIHPSLNRIIIKKSEGKQTINVENQLMKLLVLLVHNQGQLVTKEEFVDKIWEGNHHVAEQALTKNIFKLRKLLQKLEVQGSMEIETIPKKGYRLIRSNTKSSFSVKRKPWVIGSIIGLIAIIIVAVIWWRPIQTPKNNVEVIRYDENSKDTIIHLIENGKVKEFKTDSLSDKVILLDELDE